MKFEVLFVNDVTGTKRDIASAKKQDVKKKRREKSKEFGEKASQDYPIVARELEEAKRTASAICGLGCA